MRRVALTLFTVVPRHASHRRRPTCASVRANFFDLELQGARLGAVVRAPRGSSRAALQRTDFSTNRPNLTIGRAKCATPAARPTRARLHSIVRSQLIWVGLRGSYDQIVDRLECTFGQRIDPSQHARRHQQRTGLVARHRQCAAAHGAAPLTMLAVLTTHVQPLEAASAGRSLRRLFPRMRGCQQHLVPRRIVQRQAPLALER